MSDFNPGDVVHHPEHGRGIVVGGIVRWGARGGFSILRDLRDGDLRRLVVIDPEDHEEVERFQEIASRRAAEVPYAYKPGDYTRAMQAALREYNKPPKPPKPPEPTGLAAVVEDAEGERWVRVGIIAPEPWVKLGSFPKRWSDLDVVRTISEGVEEEE